MRKITFKIKEICYDHGLFINGYDYGSPCLAIIVEYFMQKTDPKGVRDVLFEYVDYFPVDITSAANKICDVLADSQLSVYDYNFSDNENESWYEFVIDNKHWKIYFTLVSGYSDYVSGQYRLVDK